jgi:hypothetical protein
VPGDFDDVTRSVLLAAGAGHKVAPTEADLLAELAKNGEYAFLAAFWANQLDWQRFYP